MPDSLLPVLIVGAGPVGLTFAAEMARHGVSARIIDKAVTTKQISKALILHVRTQEVLDAAGLGNTLLKEGQPLRRVEIIGYGNHVGHGSMEGINSPISTPNHRSPERDGTIPARSCGKPGWTCGMGNRSGWFVANGGSR